MEVLIKNEPQYCTFCGFETVHGLHNLSCVYSQSVGVLILSGLHGKKYLYFEVTHQCQL